MPQPPAEEPLVKVTLNLNAADCEFLKRVFGHGWSTEVRNLVREWVNSVRRLSP